MDNAYLISILSRISVKVDIFLLIYLLFSSIVKIVDGGLYFIFLFSSYFIFIFLFLEQLGLGLIGHAVTSVTS